MSRLALLILLLISQNIHADELAVIEVEAVKDIGRFTFGEASEISTEDLDQKATSLLAPSMEKVPGVIPVQDGGPGGRVSFFIRGTEARHLVFTLDGMKINDASNVDRQFDAAFVTSPFLKNVIIHKGPQAVLYGSDAMGGMVELQTRKGENAPETRLIINAGSFGTIDATISSDWKTRNDSGTLTLTRFHTDGISRLNEKRFNATEKDSADITQATSSSSHHWSSKAQTDLLLTYNQGKTEFDGFGVDTSENHSKSDQYVVQQRTNLALSKKDILSLRNGLSRNDRNTHSKGSSDQFYVGNIYQNELVYRREQEKLGLLAGVSNEYETVDTNQLEKNITLNSVYLQTAYSLLSSLKAQAGMRYDHHSLYGDFYTGSAGLKYEFLEQFLSLQYSQGYKAPSLYQLYGPSGSGYVVGNSELVPETNHAWEGSWGIRHENIESGVTLFQNRLSNLITYNYTNGYQNQGRFIAEGVEAYVKWVGERFVVMPSFTHQNFREEETPVLRRPYNYGTLSVSYFPIETLEFNATMRSFSSRKDLDNNEKVVKLNGYTVLDLGVHKTWAKDAAGIQIKNVFDRKYENVYGYSVLPLSVFAHYEHRF